MKLLDLFSGIGGFHLGLEQAGFEFDWVGFSEIDKYAKQTYSKHFPGAVDLGDVRTIQNQDLPKIDVITFGSPCQDFSIAGKRSGLGGDRSSLIGEAIKLVADLKPRFFIWENVKGTFSSNDGRDFWAIIQAFTNIGGYRLEWQLINTRWFLPQNRERIYLVGYIGDRCGQSVFPIGETSSLTNNIANTLQHSGGNYRGMSMVQTFTERSFDGNREDGGRAIRYHKKPGETPCLSSQMGMGGNNVPMFKIPEATKKGYAEAEEGDSINLTQPNSKTRRGRVGKGEANTIDTQMQQHTIVKSNIRRLTPTECERLQGFPDGWTEGQSDTQRYKQLGNAVTVNVVKAVAEKLRGE
jgi:DNA (cytosine-5)-methyltransferase 1